VEAEPRPGKTVSSSGLLAPATRAFGRAAAVANRRIALVRGERGFGNHAFLALLKARDLPYIAKLTPSRRPRRGRTALPIARWARACWATASKSDRALIRLGSGAVRAGSSRCVRGSEAEQGALPELPVILEEQFLAPTQHWLEEDILHRYNRRCTLGPAACGASMPSARTASPPTCC
jgi:hypothetical protein